MNSSKYVAILGAGNIGLSIADGLVSSKLYNSNNIYLTRRKIESLKEYTENGFKVTIDNQQAVKESDIIIIAVQPRQLNGLIEEIKKNINIEKHLVISIVSGVSIKAMKELLGGSVNVIRAMPNTAIAIKESMTCLSAETKTNGALKIAKTIFDSVGKTLIIDEDLMVPATALCACGIAFFLRAIRAASQGGIEIGFHSEEALTMAAQTAKGAASLILDMGSHPESEVDKVTTPRGCTISGLNQLEHNGFSSALIKGIITSADKAAKLYKIDSYL
ncbi:MAG TPA: pyrroline-5-carboxylate reductase [Ignavibacteria bacterium]|nr:pyrroline-5-carboxylate reductase [Ignavibacteria bacterium]